MECVNTIDVADLASLAHPVLIDVREVHEFVSGHAVGAINLPMSSLADRLSEVPAGRPVYVICESGARSERVGLWLIGQGIDSVNVLGGTAEWRSAGLPVEVGA